MKVAWNEFRREVDQSERRHPFRRRRRRRFKATNAQCFNILEWAAGRELYAKQIKGEKGQDKNPVSAIAKKPVGAVAKNSVGASKGR